MLPGNFFRVQKVFARAEVFACIIERKLFNYWYSFRVFWTAFYMSGLFENFPHSFKIVVYFQMISKLSRRFKLSGSCRLTSKSSKRFQNCPDLSGLSQNFPDSSKLSGQFKTVRIFSVDFKIFQAGSKLYVLQPWIPHNS